MTLAFLGEKDNKIQTFLQKAFIGSEKLLECVVPMFVSKHPSICVIVIWESTHTHSIYEKEHFLSSFTSSNQDLFENTF